MVDLQLEEARPPGEANDVRPQLHVEEVEPAGLCEEAKEETYQLSDPCKAPHVEQQEEVAESQQPPLWPSKKFPDLEHGPMHPAFSLLQREEPAPF